MVLVHVLDGAGSRDTDAVMRRSLSGVSERQCGFDDFAADWLLRIAIVEGGSVGVLDQASFERAVDVAPVASPISR